jgi:glyoxylase-like metal-dependent hydrolase (beta-lactamase superfamily II)
MVAAHSCPSTPAGELLMRRRRWLAWVGASMGGLVGCSSGAPVGGAADAVDLQPVAPGVWMARGRGGEVDAANRGRIGNAGVIVGERGALVIDSGVSWRHGRALLAAARRVSPQPVRGLLLTHVRQEFVFGAAAFQEAGVPVLMHPAAAGLMRARCEGCLKTLQRVLGPDEMQGSRVVQVDELLTSGSPAALAERIGRPLQLLTFGAQAHSSGPGDVALLDGPSGTLFAGGLLDADTIPDVQDADFAGWRAALAALRSLPIERIVPGHGPLAPPALIGRIAAYLDALESRTAALLAAGTPLSEVADATELPAFAGWDQYDTIHRRNASIVFLRHERDMLRRPDKEGP